MSADRYAGGLGRRRSDPFGTRVSPDNSAASLESGADPSKVSFDADLLCEASIINSVTADCVHAVRHGA